jgi:hypothetical protein
MLTNMTRLALLAPALLSLALACAVPGDPPTDSNAEGTGAGDESSTQAEDTGDETSSETGGEALEVIVLDTAWVESLAGGWSGPVDPTPTGPVPFFPLSFAWEDDGSLHAHTDNPGGGYFDFRLYQADGTWVFDEEGVLPGGLTQSYVLHPIARDGDWVRFVTLDAPSFLIVDIGVTGSELTMLVQVMGIEHAAFSLER